MEKVLMFRKSLLIAFVLLALLWTGPAAPSQSPPSGRRTQVRFAGPSGMQMRWYVRSADGKEGYSEPPLVVPARYNFRQGYSYRLQLSRIPGHPDLEVYVTLEVRAAGPAAEPFLANSAVQVEFNDGDFQSALAGRYVVKTVYQPGSGRLPLLVIHLGNRVK
jgi:hypothetical protein